MQSQVIVPLDGSTEAEAILPHALFFALQAQSVLTLLRVIMPPGEPEYMSPSIPDDWYEGEVSWTRRYLGGLVTRLEARGAHVKIEHVEGVHAGAAISTYAAQHPGVQLIALATHGRSAGGRLLLGSVTGEVGAEAKTSLLLLHPPVNAQLPPGPIAQASYQTVVVPLDAMVSSERVLERATGLALACQASLLLVVDPPPPLLDQQVRVQEEMKETGYLEEQAERLRASTGLAVRTAFTEGDPETFIEPLQGEFRQPLLIVTTRQQSEHKVMRFLHQSNVPVLFVGYETEENHDD